MASLEPPPLDFNDPFTNDDDSNDELFTPSIPSSLNNLVQDKEEQNVLREKSFVEDQVCYKPPSGFKQVDHASPVTSLDFQVEAPLDERNDDKIHVSVSDPKKIGENMSAYITYKVTTKTTMPTFTSREMEVYRRFSDFYALYERLLEKHSQEGRFVPLPPEKNILSMAKVKVAKEDASSSDFVERRRKLLERFLRRIANHPQLRNDPSFVDFLESEGSTIRPPSKGMMGAGGFLKFFQKVEDSFNKVTYKMEENDKWFEKKEAHLNIMEECLQSTCWCLESLIFHKKEFSQNFVLLSKSIGCMSPAEEEGSLCKVLTHLSEVWEGVSSCHNEHLEEGCITLLEFIKECLGSIISAKETMMMRVKLNKIWKDNEIILAKKREAKVRMELAYKTDKIAEANRDIAEWEQCVERSQEDFERISHNIKDEMKRFDNLLAKDSKEALLSFLGSTLSSQQKIIKNWETFLNGTRQE